MTEENEDQWEEGWGAYIDGVPIQENPWIEGTPNYTDWEEGWLRAKYSETWPEWDDG